MDVGSSYPNAAREVFCKNSRPVSRAPTTKDYTTPPSPEPAASPANATRSPVAPVPSSRLADPTLGQVLNQAATATGFQPGADQGADADHAAKDATAKDTSGSLDDAAAALPADIKSIADQIAQDKSFAAFYAESLSCNRLMYLGNVKEAVKNPEKWQAASEELGKTNQQRTELYHSLVASGTSSANICVELMNFDLSRPASYRDALDPTHSYAADHQPLEFERGLLSALQKNLKAQAPAIANSSS